MTLPALTPKVAKELKGKRVLLRLGLNVSLNGQNVRDDFRLQRILPTLKLLHSSGARTIVISHIGPDGEASFRPVVRFLNRFLSVGFTPDSERAETLELIGRMEDGEILVIENLRRFEGEEANDKSFAKDLAKLGDVFVNEDFAVSHRNHASIVGLPKLLPSYVGPLFTEEVENLSKAFKPTHPFVFILGGAKFETKIPLVERFLGTADKTIISGALANTFFKELGYEVGKSLVDEKLLGTKRFSALDEVMLPLDVVVRNSKGVFTKDAKKLSREDFVVDVGPETVAMMKKIIKPAKFILWNGPFGRFEDGFSESTEEIAQEVAKGSAYSVVGGGDTVAAIGKLGLLGKFSFVSTGGGAMLEFLASGTLPGIKAIQNSKL